MLSRYLISTNSQRTRRFCDGLKPSWVILSFGAMTWH